MSEYESLKSHIEYCIYLASQTMPRFSTPKYKRGYENSPIFLRPPYVASLVLDEYGEVISKGTKRFIDGTSLVMHAERDALDKVNGKKAHTLVTTLQPCFQISRHQLLSSCTDLVIERGIKRVVFGIEDLSHPDLNKKSTRKLTDAGIELVEIPDFREQIKRQLLKFKY